MLKRQAVARDRLINSSLGKTVGNKSIKVPVIEYIGPDKGLVEISTAVATVTGAVTTVAANASNICNLVKTGTQSWQAAYNSGYILAVEYGQPTAEELADLTLNYGFDVKDYFKSKLSPVGLI